MRVTVATSTSKSPTVSQYLRQLDPERRSVLSTVRKVVNDNLPRGYAEGVGFGMITWQVPLARYPDTYNGQPLCSVGLSAQKNHNSLYLMGPYGDPEQRRLLEREFRKRGLKLDMAKSCLRFKTLDDLPLDVIGAIIRRTPPKALMAMHESGHRRK
jgi:hypothetical protein